MKSFCKRVKTSKSARLFVECNKSGVWAAPNFYAFFGPRASSASLGLCALFKLLGLFRAPNFFCAFSKLRGLFWAPGTFPYLSMLWALGNLVLTTFKKRTRPFQIRQAHPKKKRLFHLMFGAASFKRGS